MEITDIKIRRLNADGDGKMKAIVSITINDALAVHDIKVIEGKDRIFVAMPSRKTPKNEFKDIVHPISSDIRDYIESTILKAYKESL